MSVTTWKQKKAVQRTKSPTVEFRFTNHSMFSRFVDRPDKLGTSFGSSSLPYLQRTHSASKTLLYRSGFSVLKCSGSVFLWQHHSSQHICNDSHDNSNNSNNAGCRLIAFLFEFHRFWQIHPKNLYLANVQYNECFPHLSEATSPTLRVTPVMQPCYFLA